MSKIRWMGPVVVVIGIGSVAAWPQFSERFLVVAPPVWQTVPVTRGDIVETVNATGTVRPMVSVPVGAPVSGPIIEVHVDYNSVVQKGDLLAKIDPQVYQANVNRDRAILATKQGDVQRVEALLEQTRRDEARAKQLREKNPDFISDTEFDSLHFNRLQLEAQLLIARAGVEQAQGNLDNSETNLAYTEIRAPVSGTILERRIQSGQTLASQFQVPELFLIAPDLEREIHVIASVGEVDVGRIQRAQQRQLPVTFKVDAYPHDEFTGVIFQVRIHSTTTQNIVTYPVLVSAPNSERKLLPGMTATLYFVVDRQSDVIRVPNEAFRYVPDIKRIHPHDRQQFVNRIKPGLSKTESLDSREHRAMSEIRQLWVANGKYVRPIQVEAGLTNERYTEVLGNTLTVGQLLVAGEGPR